MDFYIKLIGVGLIIGVTYYLYLFSTIEQT